MKRILWLSNSLDKETLLGLIEFLGGAPISLVRANISLPKWGAESLDMVRDLKNSFRVDVLAGDIPANVAAMIAAYNVMMSTPEEGVPIPFILPIWQGGGIHHWEWL